MNHTGDPAMLDFFVWISVVILFLVLLCMYRVFRGPGVINRIVAINVVGTKTITVVLFIGLIFQKIDFFTDIALVYALINFIGVLAFSKYFEKKGVV